MRVKENEKIPLRIPRFSVDKPINPEIEKYDVLQFLNRSSINCILGVSGSGKTSLLYSFLISTKPKIWKKQYENIIVVMPPQSRKSLENNIFDKYLEETTFNHLDEETMEVIHEMVEQNAEENTHTLLILDDVATALKNPFVAKKLQHLAYAYRHYKLNIVLLVQTLKTIPLPIRKNITNLVVFYKPRISEWEAITEEYLEMKKDQSKELYEIIFKKKYDWAMINLTTGRVFKDFDEILWKEENLIDNK